MRFLRAHGRQSCSQRTLVLFVVLCCLNNANCIFNDLEYGRSSPQKDDQFTPAVAAAIATAEAAAAGAHGRSLLQNPDRPALNKYGGVNMTQMLAAGYPLETYKVNTPDGWVLSLYRIPYGRKRNNVPGKRPVIYLQHGFTLSSACFTLLNENESMAYILADAGFDVWLPNIRGNTFSTGNYRFSRREFEYWYHSFDEYALVDSPAMIDKALEVSGASKLAFVGHSQGGTMGYALLSGLPQYQEKVSVLIQMAPVAFVDFFNPPVLIGMAERSGPQFLLDHARVGQLMVYNVLAPYVPQCKDWFMTELCMAAVSTIAFGPSSNIAADDYIVIGQTWPATVSSRTLDHWAQLYLRQSRRLLHYDHGTNCSAAEPFKETCNQQKYGSLTPPEYELGRIKTPVAILSGGKDIMCVPADIAIQASRLVNARVTQIVYADYAHMDFIWDRNARHMMDVVDIAFRYSPGTW